MPVSSGPTLLGSYGSSPLTPASLHVFFWLHDCTWWVLHMVFDLAVVGVLPRCTPYIYSLCPACPAHSLSCSKIPLVHAAATRLKSLVPMPTVLAAPSAHPTAAAKSAPE